MYTLNTANDELRSVVYNGTTIWTEDEQMDDMFMEPSTYAMLIRLKNYAPAMYDYIVEYVTTFGNYTKQEYEMILLTILLVILIVVEIYSSR